MGYRDAQTFLLDEFKEQGDCYVATEDGSVGAKGNVLDAIKEYKLNADVIYACGDDTDAAGVESVCSRAGHDLLYFHGRTDGMRNRCMSGMCAIPKKKMHIPM